MADPPGAGQGSPAPTLDASDAPYVLLEDRLAGNGRARLFREPVEIVRCDEPQDIDRAFAALDRGLSRGLHAAGFLSYELGYLLEARLAGLLPAARDVPLLWFGLFPPPLAVDGREMDAMLARRAPPPLADLRLGHDRDVHVAKAREILAHIVAGDIYQANLTFPIHFRHDGDPLALYAALRAAQPVAHGGVVATGDISILSVSPELFVRIAGDHVEARPMKGTVPRGADTVRDAGLRAALLADPKQRAENLMIVDLLRNDLARISEAGSIAVPDLFTLETYPTLHTLTSRVTGRLRRNTTLRERIAALFPCGSVVGAPKVRAAEILAAAEGRPRGVYTGSIGAIAPGGDLDFNVAIRTAVVGASGEGCYGVGGGIVADSDPDAEFDEALLKARILTDLTLPYSLVETFRWRAASAFVRRDAHLARLAVSAAELGFACDPAAIRQRLDTAAECWRDQDMRVRLTLARAGQPEVSAEPVAPQPARPRLLVSAYRLDAADPFLRHKTTRRMIHEAAFAEAQRAGFDEAILLNRQDHVADGSRNSIFVELDGRMVTPPIGEGALPGVLRAQMLSSGDAVAASVPLAVAMSAGRLWIGNSLHGLREAQALVAVT